MSPEGPTRSLSAASQNKDGEAKLSRPEQTAACRVEWFDGRTLFPAQAARRVAQWREGSLGVGVTASRPAEGRAGGRRV